MKVLGNTETHTFILSNYIDLFAPFESHFITFIWSPCSVFVNKKKKDGQLLNMFFPKKLNPVFSETPMSFNCC